MSKPLSSKLEAIELEIDNFYKTNLLVKFDFAFAGWNLLAFAEDMMLKPVISNSSISSHEYKIAIDHLLVNLKYPLFWLSSSCSRNGVISTSYTDEAYMAAWEMMKLGKEYDVFWAMFTYARRNWIELILRDDEITITKQSFLDDTRYEAYNRLIEPRTERPSIESSELFELISRSLKINGEQFLYKLNPRMVSIATQKVIEPIVDTMFSLPSNWQFSRYSLGDFRQVFTSIAAIAFIHFYARVLAAQSGCAGLGIASSIYIPTREELKRRVARYSGVQYGVVSMIFNDIVYGSQGMKFPDPVLQPLISLNEKTYAVMPHLWMGNAAERNFTVLLNRLPQERKIYARLVEEKEVLMRNRIKKALSHLQLRFFHGKIPNRPDLADIDLAIIDDREKVCLLTELKWFIYPAEIREVIEKLQELEKGVSQLLLLNQAITENFEPFSDKLAIEPSFSIYSVLISANWIGFSNVQCPNVPIINEEHLVRKFNEAKKLRVVADWLISKKYLPREGLHYQIVDNPAQIGQWRLKWYGIKPLIADSLLSI